MSRNNHCCLCGEVRLPHQPPVEELGNKITTLIMREHRELKPGRWEISPQMLVSVGLWRNGGTARGDTHICDGCLVVGLEEARRFVEYELTTRRAMLQAHAALVAASPQAEKEGE